MLSPRPRRFVREHLNEAVHEFPALRRRGAWVVVGICFLPGARGAVLEQPTVARRHNGSVHRTTFSRMGGRVALPFPRRLLRPVDSRPALLLCRATGGARPSWNIHYKDIPPEASCVAADERNSESAYARQEKRYARRFSRVSPTMRSPSESSNPPRPPNSRRSRNGAREGAMVPETANAVGVLASQCTKDLFTWCVHV